MNVKKLALPVLREAFPTKAKYKALCAEVDKLISAYRPRVKCRPRDLALREQIRQEVFPLIDKTMKIRFKIDERPYDLRVVLSVSEALVQAMVEVAVEEIGQDNVDAEPD